LQLFFDESGTSGANLNDANTPVFVLASNNLTTTEAVKLLSDCFGTSTQEIKYSEVIREKPQSVARFLYTIAKEPDGFSYYVLHKPFTNFVQFLRYWFQPWLVASGSKLNEVADPVFKPTYSSQNFIAMLSKSVSSMQLSISFRG
jgi:hypothetical protein